jgi:BlaI family transcriptional regulator, penicillinase repressor
MKEITKAQEEILQILWEIKEGVVSDVLEKLPNPKPAYTTVSTVIRVLEKKGYVNHKTYGKVHLYYPRVSKKEYTNYWLKGTLSHFFNNSLNQAVSFFAKHKSLSINELEELKQFVENEIKKNQEKN